ncbi:hypothetical protein DTO282F9_929 [Paecilomyces variotii]|nr:hypothetical protein DTO282F9_929 [Paecilomyces variotii]
MQGFRLWDAPALKRRYCTGQDHARHLYVHCCPATALKDFGAGLSHTRNFKAITQHAILPSWTWRPSVMDSGEHNCPFSLRPRTTIK